MATLVSPGVSVTVTDESFYAAAGTGTVPLIIIATAQDKSAPDGSGVAAFTTQAEAGNVKLITSQRELLTNYGNPEFKTLNGTPLHGHELNEYGLQAAYSFMGLANRAYILRADVNLDELDAQESEPTSPPAGGSYWLDITSSQLGIKRYDGTDWVAQSVGFFGASEVTGTVALENVAPKTSTGLNGTFKALVVDSEGNTTTTIKIYEKISGAWFHVGTSGWDSASGAADFQIAPHTALPVLRSTDAALEAGDVVLQTTTPNNGTALSVKVYDTASGQYLTESVVNYEASFAAYDDYTAQGGVQLGDTWADFTADDATILIKRHNGSSSLIIDEPTTVQLADVVLDQADAAGNIALRIIINDNDIQQTGNVGIIDVSLDGYASANTDITVEDAYTAINDALSAANESLTQASELVISDVDGQFTVSSANGLNIRFESAEVAGFGPGSIYLGTEDAVTDPATFSNWEDLNYTASASELTGDLVDGTLWYDSLVSNTNIDILYNNNGTWETYTGDVNVAASEPTLQSDLTALEPGDLWVSSADLENYPAIYKWSGSVWVQIDTADGDSADGIVFADVRASATASFDSDAPNVALYPYGILVWNKRASGGNIKQWDETNSRWVDYSGNKNDGSPYMLRKAQRRAVVRQLQEAISTNTDIRNEGNRFNLLACPGYPELMDEMITLNVDRKETAFIIGDTPLRLASDATSIQSWATNANNAVENGEDGLISNYAYSGVYYPHGLTSSLDGTNIVVPSSHIALRTLAFNDQVAFPWFAPAGFQRGVVTNATSVGYIKASSGEYVPVSLSEGQRDVLYVNNVNPIGNFPNRGLAVFGQKTLSPNASALDRINVARLVVYIRERLDDIVKPFLFEPNDELTRANAKVVVDRFLGNLVSQRGLFDFVTVCDASNNTPARIDRNELWIDVAIQPVKAVEFIYIPVRVQNTLGQTN